MQYWGVFRRVAQSGQRYCAQGCSQSVQRPGRQGVHATHGQRSPGADGRPTEDCGLCGVAHQLGALRHQHGVPLQTPQVQSQFQRSTHSGCTLGVLSAWMRQLTQHSLRNHSLLAGLGGLQSHGTLRRIYQERRVTLCQSRLYQVLERWICRKQEQWHYNSVQT